MPAETGTSDSDRPTPESPNGGAPAASCLPEEGDLPEQFRQLYEEIRRIARRSLRAGSWSWQRDATLATTALVHESFMRLADGQRPRWESQDHFLSLAARAMRFVLVDYARSRMREKRGASYQRVPFDEATALSEDRAREVLDLDRALEALARRNRRLCRVVECRYVAGMTLEETAAALSVSSMTVKRDWGVARAFLARELGGDVLE